MRRALVLSVILVSGCGQAGGPAGADAAAKSAAAKASKEMSDLLKKADAIVAKNTAPAAAAAQPAPHPAVAPAVPPPAPPAEPQYVAPVKSKADTVREQAAASYGERLSSLRRTAEASRLKKDRFQQVCQGKASEMKAECQMLTADLTDASRTIERELGDIQETAKRAGTDPGVMRDLLAKYGF